MKDLETLKKEYKAKIEAARAKAKEAGDQPMSKDLATAVNGLLAEADEIKAQIDIAQRMADGEAYLNEPAGTKAAHHGWRESGPDEGNAPVDTKAFRSFEIAVLTPFGVEKKEFRFHVPIAVQKKGYAPAYEAFLRYGKANMGPNDLKALSEATEAGGAVLVPEDMQTSVLKKTATNAVVRQFARVITTSRDMVKWPRVKYTTNNEYTSGVRLTWTGETPASATTHRVTDQVFGEINIPVATAMASQLHSADLLEDAAFDVMGISSDLFGEAFGLGENDRFWNGNGANQPRGIITDASDTTNFDAAIATVATANTIVADEVIDVCYALPAQYERGARWFMTKATEKAIRKLATTDGYYVWPVVSQVGNLGVVEKELLGFPTTRDEAIDEISDATNTTTYPIIFGDLNAYVIVDRVGLSIKRDDSLYSETNQVLLLARKRVGGQLVEAYKLSLLKSVNTT